MRATRYNFVNIRFLVRKNMWDDQSYSPAVVTFTDDGFVHIQGQRRADLGSVFMNVTDQYPARRIISIKGNEEGAENAIGAERPAHP